MSKRFIEPLVDGRVRLRLLEERDLPLTLAWRNRDDIRRWFFKSDVIAPGQHRAWFDRYQQRDDDFVFIIEETETLLRPVGQIALYDVDWAGKRAEFGRLMIGDQAARRCGLARLATTVLVDDALTRWGLDEIYLQCVADNDRALAVYTACGFEETARTDSIVTMTRLAGGTDR
jgi:RimJ/RimL family protein N-acetyltransferase